MRQPKILSIPHAALTSRVEGEYREMPGLSITVEQASRLWQLSPEMCKATLDLLVGRKFLTRTSRGMYVKRNSDAA